MNYREIFTFRRLWAMFGVLMVAMFSVLLLVGGRAFQEAPPMPECESRRQNDHGNGWVI